MSASRISVLVAAAGASWETQALRQLAAAGPGIVLLKRCVDLNDLLATAATGQADVALVAGGLPGLDVDAVGLLRRAGAAPVLVVGEADPCENARVKRLGIDRVVDESSLAGLTEAVAQAGTDTRSLEPSDRLDPVEIEEEGPPRDGRLVAVWGPAGAPGRTTVAVGLAAELAYRGRQAFLVDADAYGGAVGQHLGVLDEMSGLLAAARTANAGRLDEARLAGMARTVDPSLRVLTGLPRADRWTEVREGAFDEILRLARSLAEYVVIDTSFCLEEDPSVGFGDVGPRRNGMTLTAVEQADELVVVGSADPVGLARLARGLLELLEAVPGRSVRVVVNRTRSSLGWREKDVRAMVEGFVTPMSMHFLPDDRPAADRAIMAGRSLVAAGDSPLRRAVAELAAAVTGQQPAPRTRRGAARIRR